ncbi:uncharacterized protein LOC125044893 [Penaeus chinensis]|uniref:uncharacterized protein LOC125044893 n=1 Tax=Penaeus chinensis TaxID=139456 RepID=UPI001FB5BD45|nr:uncharacterized protein LOC125044893 [Penaeus chinensis]
MVIIRQVQKTCFAEELDILKRGKNWKASRIYCLEPHLDDQGLLRVGGRRVDEYMDQNSRRPLILPKDHPVITLIVQDIHVFSARHSGREHTLTELRRKYWIVAGRPLIDRILCNCFTCRRINSKPLTQRQGDLPVERVTPWGPPFYHNGVDCFGPFYVVCKRHAEKRFGCVFPCFSTRAVHFEHLKSLDASTFLSALMCVISHRGTQMEIYSDRGTNFLRAEREL